ncbi:MAG: acetolactate synthase large subunit [Spirochaetia bacterium]|jgi:acetolactate synthase-1/2/3 large subunit|nr:acetolactate synthase large subunit [Spirochaetia bacterium]
MDGNKKNTATLLVECLEAEGVKYVFGIPGEETLELMNALEKSTIEFIPTRHEQGAAFMADVYGRLTGKAGVCLSTLGPGATNLVTGVADANMDGAPLVAITGQAGTDRMHLTSHQYVDLVKMFEPITKRSKAVVRPDTVMEIVRIAFKYAESEKPGASHIDLPCNIAKMEVDGHPMKKVPAQEGQATFQSIEEAATVISRAQKPVILAGSSAARNNCGEAVTKFAEKLKIPVVNTMMGKGIIPWTNKYSMWSFGIPQKDYPDLVFKQADLVIAIGYDLVECTPIKWNPDGDKRIIHIGPESAHINKRYEAEIEVIGNIEDSLQEIQRRAYRKEVPEWAFAIRNQMVAEFESYADDDSFPMKPQKILYDVRKVMDAGSILISDVGAHKMWIGREYNCERPNSCIISNGFATMGISVPGAIAAKLVYPDKKILAICGDGGFMMNVQELETAVRCKTNFVVLILTDSAYGLIKWKQDERFGHHCYVDFTNPDFVALARAMGCEGMKIEKCKDLIPSLENAFSMDKPVIIDCPVDYSENMKLTEHLKKLTEGKL